MVSTSSSPAGPAEADSPVVHVPFSGGASHFVASTTTGFHVFSCGESVERVRYKSIADVSYGAEVTSAEMLTWSRLAVVTRKTGGAEHDAIYFFDEESKRTIRISSAKTPSLGVVGGVRLLGDHAIIAGQEMAMLVVRGDIKNSELVETGPNPLGLCALAVDRREATYALPRPEKGAVVDVRAHGSGVACLALSRDGRLLATAGSKGTLVRIFSTDDGTKLQELRRGIDRADIHCIVLSSDSRWLAVSSDKGTVHVFPVSSADKATKAGADSDTLPVTPPATAPVPATAKQGSFYRCRFDPVNAGEMKQLEHERFIKKINE
ncbi:hypothetical protein CFC21_021866 [Triticum aestivum]|uniref:Anaphase-promoting complex subunit 4 WD40 domain-containing protein n=2 Tax=Triticum aestivum TaxID=4565 RepID=A0A3B6C0G1_WHEAT|nr:hypothetical protein CFC21_021866 [Triticum aestivum]